MTADRLRLAVVAAADALEAAREQLCELDGIAGDGDHGVTMTLAARAVRKCLADAPEATPDDLLAMIATAVASVGGASGPLFSTAIKSIGDDARALAPASSVTTAGARRFAESACRGVATLGGASRGDKTLLDALVPAVEALRAAEAAGLPLGPAARSAADAARAGAEATADMVATVGRAARLGERSRGAADPGATSIAIVLDALARVAEMPERRGAS
jgi:phosphoenolpyruvate---glycerone phosphotransferase subunit DhaL